MTVHAEPLVEIWRGTFLESVHTGHIVISDAKGNIVESWGDPDKVILPRSSAKMIQALPLVASGAADAHRLSAERLALACASHDGAPIHVAAVNAWLADLDLSDDNLICGPQESRDEEQRLKMIRGYEAPCRVHNNCSGKHTGFLTLARHLDAPLDYVDPCNLVQCAVREVFEKVTGEATPGYGIDGCSAPNFATTVHGLARAMAWFASAQDRAGVLDQAGERLVAAMYDFPELVAGDGRACTDLMRASDTPIAVKTGAEGVFVAILPELRLGVALKIADGATRASESALAAVLVKLGILSVDNPAVQKFMTPGICNWDGLQTGFVRPDKSLYQ